MKAVKEREVSVNQRAEFILRVKGVPPEHAETVEKYLENIARKLPLTTTLSRVDREHYADHALHKRRRKIV